MSDSATSFSAKLPGKLPVDDLVRGLLEMSQTAMALYVPVREAGGIVDFSIPLLNPAAQQLLHLPAQPTQTLGQLYPNHAQNAGFDFFRRVFESGEPGQQDLSYSPNKPDKRTSVAARRVGEGLLISFAKATAPDAAAADAESQYLTSFFMQAPAAICIHRGPDHIYELVNPAYQEIIGNRPLLGRPMREAMPELVGQGIYEILDRVYHSGQPEQASEVPVLYHFDGQRPTRRYYNLTYQARRNRQGQVDGVIVLATNVTELVEARHRVEASEAQTATANQELAAAYEELHVANEEIQASNEDLVHTQLTLRELNQGLEERVADRTERLQLARADAERQRARLERFFMQAPAAVCILDGPNLTFELVNPAYQALFPGRRLLGHALLEALPEIADHAVYTTFRSVYETGQTHEEHSLLIPIARPSDGKMEDRYFNFIQQARFNEAGAIDGVLVFAFEVTQQVLAHQLVGRVQAEALHAADQLVRQRETLYQVFEQTPASVAILRGPEHRFEYVNPGYQALFAGRTLLGRPLAEALPETVEFGFLDLLNQVYATGEAFFGTELPLQIHDAEGHLLPEAYYTFTYQAYKEAGVTLGVSIFAFDVTEQVLARRRSEALQAEALHAADQLVRQRETLHQVFEQTPALVFIARGPEHRIDYVNPAYQALFPNRQLVGKTTAEAIPESVEHGFIALLDNVYATSTPYFGNEVLASGTDSASPNGVRYLNFTYQAYQENGKTVGVSSFAFDVTEQVLARQRAASLQEEVRQRDAQLQALFEQAPVAIAVLRGEQFVVELANSRMCGLWGRTSEELLGNPLFEAMPELRGQGFYLLLQSVLSTGVAYAAQETPVQLKRNRQPETLYTNFVYQPLRDTEGNITGVAVVATDVSEQVQARQLLAQANQEMTAAHQAVSARNDELAAANQQLVRTNQDLDNFVYAASHDLKQPINNLAGLFEELRFSTTYTDPEEKAILEPMVDDALRQLATTINDLATVGQAQQLAGLPAETVALDEVTNEVLQTLQPQVLAARARITTDFSARPTIRYARANLRTILLNLVGNSLKYADPARACRVHLSMWVQDGRPMLMVEDNGLGFDVQRHHDELFHLFRRFHDHTEGTGVGLYLVNRIVQSNGGRVEVESEVGEGTTFRVFL